MGVYLHYESDTDLSRRTFEEPGGLWMVSVKRIGRYAKIPYLLGVDPDPFLETMGCDPERYRSAAELDGSARASYRSEIPTPEIERLLEYCTDALRAIGTAVDVERVAEQRDRVPDGEAARDYLDHFEYDAWRAFGVFRSICTMCRNALNEGIALQTA